MTMQELAKLANVSISTVSKAFSDAGDVSEETREHIFAIARQQGCFGKFYKEKYNKKIIAVICHELDSGYYTVYLKHLQQLIEAGGGICLISTDNFDHRKQAELVEYYASYLKVDGLIVFSLAQPLKKGYDVPIVSLFSSNDPRVDSVNTDMDLAIGEAVDTLLAYGHRRMAFLGEPLTRSKAESFRQAVERADVPYVIAESPRRFEEAGVDGVTRLMELGADFTALICAYDYIAFGAIKKLQECGYRIPEDISVIGIDNISAGRFVQTTLTTIDTLPEEMCAIAWELLQKKLENKYFKAKQSIVIKPRLILRESVAKKEADVCN